MGEALTTPPEQGEEHYHNIEVIRAKFTKKRQAVFDEFTEYLEHAIPEHATLSMCMIEFYKLMDGLEDQERTAINEGARFLVKQVIKPLPL